LDLSSELDQIVMRALAYNAEDRYTTARDFAEALSRSAEATSAGVVADWVQRLAEKPLLERARLLAQVENWDDGSPEIELSSTPFAVEKDILALEDYATGDHSPRPPGARGHRASRPTPLPPVSTHASPPPRTEAVLGARAPLQAFAGVSKSLQPLLEHPRLRPLVRQLPPDPLVRMTVLVSGVLLLVLLLYLALR
jgi:hypothetical protein